MIGLLGKPYKISFSAVNFASGHTVTAKVLRPDGSLHGNYSLTEFADPMFAGVYWFDLITTQLMPEGEYTVVIKDNEANFRQIYKVAMRISYGSTESQEECQSIIGIMRQNKLSAIIASKKISATMMVNKISGNVKILKLNAKISSQILSAQIKQQKIIGVLSCHQL